MAVYRTRAGCLLITVAKSWWNSLCNKTMMALSTITILRILRRRPGVRSLRYLLDGNGASRYQSVVEGCRRTGEQGHEHEQTGGRGRGSYWDSCCCAFGVLFLVFGIGFEDEVVNGESGACLESDGVWVCDKWIDEALCIVDLSVPYVCIYVHLYPS